MYMIDNKMFIVGTISNHCLHFEIFNNRSYDVICQMCSWFYMLEYILPHRPLVSMLSTIKDKFWA